MTQQFDQAVALRRENARGQNDGRFGKQPHTDPGVVPPVHGDEIRAHLSEAVEDAMGGPWLLDPEASPYVAWYGSGGLGMDRLEVVGESLHSPYAGNDVARTVARALPVLPADRAAWHAEQIAQATVMDSLYSSETLDRVRTLEWFELKGTTDLLLTDRDQFRGQGGYDWNDWAEAEAEAWSAERFRRLSAAVDESSRLVAGHAA